MLIRAHVPPFVSIHALCRDVKPSNILLTEDGRAKVSDMGLSRAEFFSSSHAVAGTFLYAAPEVLLGRPSNDKVLTCTTPTSAFTIKALAYLKAQALVPDASLTAAAASPYQTSSTWTGSKSVTSLALLHKWQLSPGTSFSRASFCYLTVRRPRCLMAR